jgi:hypothetical protein
MVDIRADTPSSWRVPCIQRRISPSAPWWAMAGLLWSMGCGFQSPAGPAGIADGGNTDGSSTSDGGPTVACYGPPSGPWRVCPDATPTGAVTLPAMLDTDTSSLCLPAQPTGWTAGPQPEACFIVGDIVSVVVSMATKVTGSRPLVLVAHTQITIANVLDAASHQSDNSTNQGPALLTGDCSNFTGDPVAGSGAGAGGGAGGSFITQGGSGGLGGPLVDNQGGQPAAANSSSPTYLRGGCTGQIGGGHGTPDTTAGRGGSAVYLVSGGTILIGSAINVSGAGATVAGSKTGGSGGGSGGMIVLYGQTIMATATGVLMANGGGGAGGAGSGGNGNGRDPSVSAPMTPAVGGGSNSGIGGQGYPATGTALDGGNGLMINDGGGGGGGAAGYIQTNQDLGTMAKISPPANLVVSP